MCDVLVVSVAGAECVRYLIVHMPRVTAVKLYFSCKCSRCVSVLVWELVILVRVLCNA